jgi:AAA+ ATPase superfamily predicted ATPase
MFVNRRKELSMLNSYLDMILSGQRINLSLFGQRRTGKTELLKRFKKEAEGLALIPYLNLERSVPRMDHFSLHFITELIREATGNDDLELSWPSILIASNQVGSKTQNAIASLINLLEKEKKDIDIISELLFKIPAQISDESGLPVIYILDEFQEVAAIHKNILHLMRANTEKEQKLNFWVAGSVFSFFNDLFEGDSPFFGQFERMDLPRFERSSSYELIDGLLPFDPGNEQKNIVFKVTGGHPFYITAICRRFHLMADMMDSMNVELLKSSIMMEVFDKTGSINAHFDYLMDVSLSRLRNKTMYNNILYHISREKDTLTGISYALGKPSGEVSSYMKGLLKTEIIEKSEDLYSLSDPLMGAWLSTRYEHNNIIFEWNARDKVFEDLLESYCAVSTELGKTKEFELRDKLSILYDLSLKPYSTPDGQIELDLVGEKSVPYIFEIKWRNRPVDIRTMMRFHSKVKKSKFSTGNEKLFMVSKGGSDRKAMDFAKENGIICLNRSLEEL